MLKPGTILDDRYEIIDVVGTGGMSTVYRAKDERLKRYVAVKVLKSDYSSDANFVSKFKVEAQSSAGLIHPNIVSVYDVCEDEDRHFIVMELVDGITLKEYINLNGRLNMEQAIDFSIQIASALEVAHEHHVIHRDVKPQNIIVSKTGAIKVTDFGIAKAATSTTMSTTGIGSVHYISPEQARGGYSDERSDIYSLGITMYEMVTGKVPFEGDTNVAIALMHIQNELTAPRDLYPDIYPSFEKIILKCAQKKPERRYLTAAALIADLKRVKENPNIDIVVAPAGVTNAPTQRFSEEDMKKIKDESALKNRTDETINAGTAAAAGFAAGVAAGAADANVAPQDPFAAASAATGATSSVPEVDRSKLDKLMNENDDDDFFEDDEPAGKIQQYTPGKTSMAPARPAVQQTPAAQPQPVNAYTPNDYQEDYERPAARRGSLKKVNDYDDYDDNYDNYDYDDYDDEENVDPKLEKAVLIGGISAALIIAIVIFVILAKVMGWFNFGKKTEATTATPIATTKDADEKKTELALMPDTVGLSQEAAEKKLKEAGFVNYTFVPVNDETVQAGYVIEQNQDAKKKIDVKTAIEIKVSAGAEELDVDDVKNMKEEEADKLLKEKGFKVTHKYSFSDEVEDGLIINQSPAAGEKLAKGQTITLEVSQGKEVKDALVPNVVGKSESDAKNAIQNAKFKVGDVSYEFNSDVEAGLVISQNPNADVTTKEGTTISIVVSKGAETKNYSGTVYADVTCTDDAYLATNPTILISLYAVDSSNKEYLAIKDYAVSGDTLKGFRVQGDTSGMTDKNGGYKVTITDSNGADVSSKFGIAGGVQYN